MRFHRPAFIALIINMLLIASATSSENAGAELPTPAQIRQIYDDLADDWPEIPDVVLLVVRHAEDINYFEHPTQDTQIAIHLGKQFSPEKPQSFRNPNTPMSVVIGQALSHDEVLNWFVNQISLGQECRGIPDAGTAYFGKSVDALTLEEIAYLAAIMRAPEVFHPVASYDRAIERRNILLSQMAGYGSISAEEARSAANTALVVKTPLGNCDQNQ